MCGFVNYNRCMSPPDAVDHFERLVKDVIHMARCGAEGRSKDVKTLSRQLSVRLRAFAPAAAEELARIGSAGNMSRSARRPLPVDPDSRMSLARVYEPGSVDRPILQGHTSIQLEQIVAEHLDADRLGKAGLAPVRTGLFIGPPGVGKTMAAHWIASRLSRPLIVLDLATSISSFLGKSGQNLRALLDFGKEFECVLMLDEVDAIAKRRSDDTDLGELKRLVNVLLQELDGWPDGSLLLAATNHPDLLDPAVWRRFDSVVEFGLPAMEQRVEYFTVLGDFMGPQLVNLSAQATEGLNFADIANLIKRAKKTAVLGGIPETESLLNELTRIVHGLPMTVRREMSKSLMSLGYSQRQVSEITGTSRNTIRKSIVASEQNG